MKGAKTDELLREKAIARYIECGNASKVAREYKIPRSTLNGWLNVSAAATSKKDKSEKSEKRIAREKAAKRIEKLRQQKKEGFIIEAWSSVEHGMNLLARRLQRADEQEKELERLMEAVLSAEDLGRDELKAIAKTFANLKIEDTGRLAVIIGTLYDKAEKAAEPQKINVNISGEVKNEIAGSLKKFEDM